MHSGIQNFTYNPNFPMGTNFQQMGYGNMQGMGHGNTTLPMINNIGGQYYNPMEGNIDI